MKISRFPVWLLGLILTLFSFPLFGAEGGGTEDLPQTVSAIWTAAIAGLTPIIVWGIAKIIPKIPRQLLPLITPAIGILLGLTLKWVGGLDLGWFDMAAAGALAVFVREVVNQNVTKHLTEDSKATTLLVLVLLIPSFVLTPGCVGNRTLDPAGVYVGDSLLWKADGLIVEVDSALTDIEALAARNPGAFTSKPELGNFLLKVRAERDGVPKPGEVLTTLIQLRDAYNLSRSPENATALQQAFVAARVFLDQARALLPTITN